VVTLGVLTAVELAGWVAVESEVMPAAIKEVGR
jgi:hypothetical protein